MGEYTRRDDGGTQAAETLANRIPVSQTYGDVQTFDAFFYERGYSNEDAIAGREDYLKYLIQKTEGGAVRVVVSPLVLRLAMLRLQAADEELENTKLKLGKMGRKGETRESSGEFRKLEIDAVACARATSDWTKALKLLGITDQTMLGRVQVGMSGSALAKIQQAYARGEKLLSEAA